MLGRILQDGVVELRLDILARRFLQVKIRLFAVRAQRGPRAVEVIVLRDLDCAVAQVDGEVLRRAHEVIVALDGLHVPATLVDDILLLDIVERAQRRHDQRTEVNLAVRLDRIAHLLFIEVIILPCSRLHPLEDILRYIYAGCLTGRRCREESGSSHQAEAGVLDLAHNVSSCIVIVSV